MYLEGSRAVAKCSARRKGLLKISTLRWLPDSISTFPSGFSGFESSATGFFFWGLPSSTSLFFQVGICYWEEVTNHSGWRSRIAAWNTQIMLFRGRDLYFYLILREFSWFSFLFFINYSTLSILAGVCSLFYYYLFYIPEFWYLL